MKLSKVLFAGFLMLAMSAPTSSVFAGDKLKSPSTGIKAPNQTTVAPEQTPPSVRSWYRPKAKTYIMEEEVPRAEKLTGKTAGEGIKGGRGHDNLYKSQQGRPSIDHDWNEMNIRTKRGPGRDHLKPAPVDDVRVDGGPGRDHFKPAPLTPKEFIIIK